MSNIEHLIENALISMESNEDAYEAFQQEMAKKYNRDMLKTVHITLDELWEIAQYVKYSYCWNCEINRDTNSEYTEEEAANNWNKRV
jgi:hypothetical protein